MCKQILSAVTKLPYDTWAWKVCSRCPFSDDLFTSQYTPDVRMRMGRSIVEQIKGKDSVMAYFYDSSWESFGESLEYRLGEETRSPIPETFGIMAYKSYAAANAQISMSSTYAILLCKLSAGQKYYSANTNFLRSYPLTAAYLAESVIPLAVVKPNALKDANALIEKHFGPQRGLKNAKY